MGVFLHSMKEMSFLRNSVSSLVFFWLRIDNKSFLMPFLDFVDVADKETTEVEVEDSELADSLSGDPGRLIFFRFRGLPFNLGARWLHKYGCSSNSA